MEIQIIDSRKCDAPLIARSIMEAVGDDICQSLAGDNHTLSDVERLFVILAEMDDSQYSYRNSLTAIGDDGKAVGVCVSYDGAMLHELRAAFFINVEKELGIKMDGVEDETDCCEFYIDTLAVLPEYRGKGIASALIKATVDKASAVGKPVGLLVDKDNIMARRLYENLGFRQVGERPFCHVMMDHLQINM